MALTSLLKLFEIGALASLIPCKNGSCVNIAVKYAIAFYNYG